MNLIFTHALGCVLSTSAQVALERQKSILPSFGFEASVQGAQEAEKAIAQAYGRAVAQPEREREQSEPGLIGLVYMGSTQTRLQEVGQEDVCFFFGSMRINGRCLGCTVVPLKGCIRYPSRLKS